MRIAIREQPDVFGGNVQMREIARAQVQFPRLLSGQLGPQPVLAQGAAAQTQPEEGSHEFEILHFSLEAVGVAVGSPGADHILGAHRGPYRRSLA